MDDTGTFGTPNYFTTYEHSGTFFLTKQTDRLDERRRIMTVYEKRINAGSMETRCAKLLPAGLGLQNSTGKIYLGNPRPLNSGCLLIYENAGYNDRQILNAPWTRFSLSTG